MRLLAWLGRTGWWVTGAIVGVVLVIASISFLLPLLMPLVVTLVIAATLQPVVDWLRRHKVPPALAALVGALAVPVALALLAVLFARAVIEQASQLHGGLASDVLHAVDPRTVLLGIGSAVTSGTLAAAQFVIGVFAAAYLLFFAFKDGDRCIEWLDRRLPLRPGLTRTLLGTAAVQFRQYVLGTTVVALLDTAAITLGAVALDLPMVAVIAVVTFVGAFIPYLGAWLSAAFAVLVALGAGGLTTGLWMLAIVLVTQNILEGVLRPFVFGRALNLHPVAVLAATIVGAALGGVSGVFIAPPVAAIAASWWSAVRER